MLSTKEQISGLSADDKAIIAVALLTLLYPAGVVAVYMWNIGPRWLKMAILFPFVLLIIPFIDVMFQTFESFN